MRRFFATTLAFCFVSGLTLGAQAPDPKKVAAGKAIYDAQKCNTCHQVKGQGGKLAAALDDPAKKIPEADIRQWLTNTAAMEAKLPKKPAMPMSTFLKTHKLTPADVDNLTAYLLTLR